MLAIVAALQFLVVAQVAAAPAPGEGAAPPGEERAGDAGEPGGIPPPTPPPPADEPAPPPQTARAAAPGGPDAEEARTAAPEQRRHRSLLSAEPLRGGSAALAWAGWPSFGAAYAIGFTERDDGGISLDHDWAKSETRIGVIYRRPLAPQGSWALGGRLGISWYENFGATYLYDENHSDRGFELAPGLSVSRGAGGGTFSTIVEAPMVVTWKFDSGFLFSPRVSLAFEAPVYPDFSVGARAGVGYRAGAGEAPLREGRGEVHFLILAGYQLL